VTLEQSGKEAEKPLGKVFPKGHVALFTQASRCGGNAGYCFRRTENDTPRGNNT
jgi:hypothetical protein